MINDDKWYLTSRNYSEADSTRASPHMKANCKANPNCKPYIKEPSPIFHIFKHNIKPGGWFQALSNFWKISMQFPNIWNNNWLVVWTPLKNISQLGGLFPIDGKMFQTTNQNKVDVPKNQAVDPIVKPHQTPCRRQLHRAAGRRVGHVPSTCGTSCATLRPPGDGEKQRKLWGKWHEMTREIQ